MDDDRSPASTAHDWRGGNDGDGHDAPSRTRSLLLHGVAGAAAGYLVLHPAAMLSHHLFNASLDGSFAAVLLAFSTAHTPMAVFFVALGAVGGVLQGIYVHRLALLNQQLQRLSRTDDLTGLCNRRHLFYLLEREVRRAHRNEGRLAVAMLDVDHFKRYNDRHGHPAGDEVLKALARLLRCSVREVDVVARYGGEEFVVVLPGADLRAASKIVERLRLTVRRHPFAQAETQPPHQVTVSVGLAEMMGEVSTTTELLHAADLALYAAKRSGRDRTCTIDEAPDAESLSSAHRRNADAP